MMNNKISYVLWIIYLLLLLVLWPHTAWAFNQFETPGSQWVGWVGAAAFEGAIAALTWRLKERLENTPRYTKGWVTGRRFAFRYANVYGGGLLVAVAVSSAANWAHAVQFGQSFLVFDRYSVPPVLYTVMFGGILPVCSLLFAHILATTTGDEHEANPELERANVTIRELRAELRQTEQRALLAEQRFGAAGDLLIRLTASEQVSDRILAAHQLWPELPQRSIALIADTSPGYVSDVLSKNEVEVIEIKRPDETN